MENRERYKKIIMFFASVIIVAIETLIFTYIWYNFYLSREIIGRLFVRGNQVVIVIASPFMLLIAIAIKIYDGGPVFYKQPRLTRDNQIFMILKFRSMKIDSEEQGAQLAKKKDDRVTPVGRVIRRIHFDELPQIFNILKGDMSLVGPRPERPEIATLYGDIIPEFEYRLKVKAGLTGYAQVYGKYNTTPYDKLKLDLTYIETYSLKLDLKLLMLTFKILFQKENTEGLEVWQRTAGQENKNKDSREL